MVAKQIDQNELKTANPKYWIGLTITHLLIPLVLLISGWDLGWWQAWLYSALIIVVGLGSRIWAEKRHPGLMEERGKFGEKEGVKSWEKCFLH